MKDLLLSSFENNKLLECNKNELHGIIGGQGKENFDRVCREPNGTTTHYMGWWDSGHNNYYTDSCSD